MNMVEQEGVIAAYVYKPSVFLQGEQRAPAVFAVSQSTGRLPNILTLGEGKKFVRAKVLIPAGSRVTVWLVRPAKLPEEPMYRGLLLDCGLVPWSGPIGEELAPPWHPHISTWEQYREQLWPGCMVSSVEPASRGERPSAEHGLLPDAGERKDGDHCGR